MDETWDDLELKARVRKISINLGKYLPADYGEALAILEKAVAGLSNAFFFPDFVEVYGQDEANFDLLQPPARPAGLQLVFQLRGMSDTTTQRQRGSCQTGRLSV
ncbi:MAG: hypothetical protein LBR61_12540 [Synergistaceae bacterium]|jgi:hypothetical protein|nr:hypothetical protein [Synergistaceae bacterium]